MADTPALAAAAGTDPATSIAPTNAGTSKRFIAVCPRNRLAIAENSTNPSKHESFFSGL
jgi:hypothetical protein